MTTQSAWEVDIAKISRTIWRRRDVFFSVLGAIFLLTVVALHAVLKSYDVTASVAPVTQSSQQISGSISALAKLGGVNVGGLGAGGEQFRLFISAITSREVGDQLARDQTLMKGLFPFQWSESEQRWKEPSGILHTVSHVVQEALGIPVRPWAPPSGEDVAKLLSTKLEIDEDPKSPVVTLQMQSSHPEVALRLMRELIATIDGQLRSRAMRRVDDYIAYLTQEIQRVSVAEYRAALTEHLAEQEQIRMMASANVSFAAQIFSAPTTATVASGPKSILILVFAILIGAAVGGFIAIRADRYNWRYVRFSSVRASSAGRPERKIGSAELRPK